MMAKGSKSRWGNFVGVVIFPLWIRSEDDPLEYVQRAKSTMDIKKLSMESLICYGVIKFAMKMFGEKVIYIITINYIVIHNYIFYVYAKTRNC